MTISFKRGWMIYCWAVDLMGCWVFCPEGWFAAFNLDFDWELSASSGLSAGNCRRRILGVVATGWSEFIRFSVMMLGKMD